MKSISKIQTLEIEGTFTSVADAKAGTFTFDTKLPNCYYSEFVADSQSWIEAYNGKSAWHANGTGEAVLLFSQPARSLTELMDVHIRRAVISALRLRSKDVLTAQETERPSWPI